MQFLHTWLPVIVLLLYRKLLARLAPLLLTTTAAPELAVIRTVIQLCWSSWLPWRGSARVQLPWTYTIMVLLNLLQVAPLPLLLLLHWWTAWTGAVWLCKVPAFLGLS
jgi:hypothetical protein